MKFSTGKPPRLTAEQQEQLKQIIIGSLPHEVGFPAKFNWTLEIIASYIERESGTFKQPNKTLETIRSYKTMIAIVHLLAGKLNFTLNR